MVRIHKETERFEPDILASFQFGSLYPAYLKSFLSLQLENVPFISSPEKPSVKKNCWQTAATFTPNLAFCKVIDVSYTLRILKYKSRQLQGNHFSVS